MTKLGATGDFPEGKLNADDEGGLHELATELHSLDIGAEGGCVKIVFGKPITWLALTPAQADALAGLLVGKAAAIRLRVKKP
jgi:hypothetical protein